MRAVFNFFSMLALGLMIAAIIMLGVTGAPNAPGHMQLISPASPYLDYMSVVIGLGVGLVIAIIAQIPWADLPHRTIHWIAAHAGKIKLLVWGALFAAVLLYF